MDWCSCARGWPFRYRRSAHLNGGAVPQDSLLSSLCLARPLRVCCLKQTRPREDLEKVSFVGIISGELLPPRIHIHISPYGLLDLVESRLRISTGPPDLLVHGSNHCFYKLDLWLHEGFALEHTAMARNDGLEV